MPLYEYECMSCQRHFERIERASSQHDGVCPDCGGVAVRLLGAPALRFKGSGWYVNDYANGNGAKATEGEKESASDSAATSEAKSEKHPAKNTEEKTAPKVA
jgi:putative FmdB family regulatory protein